MDDMKHGPRRNMGSETEICFFPDWIWQLLKPSVVYVYLSMHFHPNSYMSNLKSVDNTNHVDFLGYYTLVDGWFIAVYSTMDDENS